MSHGPPDLPIHLVPPLGGLLSTRGGHGKELQPCFTIRDNLTDRHRRHILDLVREPRVGLRPRFVRRPELRLALRLALEALQRDAMV